MSSSRRDFLALSARLSGLVAIGALPAGRALAALRTAAYPFTLGIASGDPLPDGVVLWTRLAPEPLAPGGGMPPTPVGVRWEVARDEQFRQVVRRGEAAARPELAHAVHVEVDGLEPGRVYWYRFISGGEASPVGRTRTAPAPGARVDRLDVAFTSCQNYQNGFYTAHRHLSAEDVALVVHLGDYIYESGVDPRMPRQHEGPEVATLDAYRARYAHYKLDPDLQAAHAAFPWIVTPDDHEVSNNYAGVHPTPRYALDPTQFLQRRAAAYQAYYEHVPLRRTAAPHGPDAQLYRRLALGGLATVHVLDTRQYRTDQPCDEGTVVDCPGARDPNATIMGAAQSRWLQEGLAASTARWNVLANQVPIAPVARRTEQGLAQSMDKWAGYLHDRQLLTEFLRDRRIVNPVFVSGDVHVNWLSDVKVDYEDPRAPVVATEFVDTSISSGGNGSDGGRYAERMMAANPHVKFYNGQRGYLRCAITPERWTTDYRVVPYVDRPGAPVSTRASFVVEAGRPGAVPA
ncbi:MAG TPA: alkaline phosphatase D family protein [Gemmatimonadaceae bacterium]|nr:alkaline phosphatase D family protein [Gemmatimonadaceae bacterium]